MITRPYDRNNSRFDLLIYSFLTPRLSVLYFATAIAFLFLGKPALAINLTLAALYANPFVILGFQQRYGKTMQRMGLNPVMSAGVILGLLGGVVLTLGVADPAHAQFFNNAQTFFTGMTAGVGGGANFAPVIALVMNTIRALFIIYMIFGLVQVINAVRQGEEWKDLAKTPFLILVIGVLGDVLVGAIAGPGGGGAPGAPPAPGA